MRSFGLMKFVVCSVEVAIESLANERNLRKIIKNAVLLDVNNIQIHFCMTLHIIDIT